MSLKKAEPPLARRKRRDGLETRARLLDAAIDLLSKEGLGSLSSVRIAQAANTSQSGVYIHFRSIEELSVLAAEQVGERLREPLLGEWRHFREGIGAADNEAQFRNEHYLRLINILRLEWRFLELVIRYRREPTALGTMMATFMVQIRHDVTDHLVALGKNQGVTEAHKQELGYYAHLLMLLLVGAAEALEDDLHPDPNRAIIDFAAQVEALVVNAYQATKEGSESP